MVLIYEQPLRCSFKNWEGVCGQKSHRNSSCLFIMLTSEADLCLQKHASTPISALSRTAIVARPCDLSLNYSHSPLHLVVTLDLCNTWILMKIIEVDRIASLPCSIGVMKITSSIKTEDHMENVFAQCQHEPCLL